MLKFYRIEPALPLRQYIHGYWQMETGADPEWLDLVPDGYPEMSIFLRGKTVQAMGDRSAVVAPRVGIIGQLTGRFRSLLAPFTRIIYVKMYPWTPQFLFDLPMLQLNNEWAELEALTHDPVLRQLASDVQAQENVESAALCLMVIL